MTWRRTAPGNYRSGLYVIVRHAHGYCLFHDRRYSPCFPYPTLAKAQAAATARGEAHRRAVRRYQQSHRELGLCVRCSRPSVVSNLCRLHHLTDRERTRPPGSGLKKCGLCGRFGHNRRTCRWSPARSGTR